MLRFRNGLISILVVYILTIGLLPIALYNRHPGFSKSKKQAINHFRDEESARRVYDWYHSHNQESHPHVVIVVVNHRRKFDPRYFTQTMWKMDLSLRLGNLTRAGAPSPWAKFNLFLCNTDSTPQANREFARLSRFFPSVTKYTDGDPKTRSTHKLSQDEMKDNFRRDYLFCLKQAINGNPKYILMVEDDALPVDNFYLTLQTVVETMVEVKQVRGELVANRESWAFLKLCFPTNLASFHRSLLFIVEWVCLSLFLSGLVSLCKEILCQMRSCQMVVAQTRTMSYIYFLLWFVYFFVVLFFVDRQAYLNLRATSNQFLAIRPGTTCCTPAVFFPLNRAKEISHFLTDLTCSERNPMDIALAGYIERANLKQYLLVPNLFNHIGVISSLRD